MTVDRHGGSKEDFAQARADLVEEVARDFRETGDLTGRREMSPRVREALASVPRHRFVPDYNRAYAYENRPLPIGEGQTISQPYIVAIMTELAQPGPQDKVLEIGTGSGYQCAMLAELAKQVYSIEYYADLAERARKLLQEIGYTNVHMRVGDGSKGWPEEAPFDAIVVTAAGKGVPEAYIDQLAPGGRLVIPVEERGGHGGRLFGLMPEQHLMLVTKGDNGKVEYKKLLPVAFVPLLGK